MTWALKRQIFYVGIFLLFIAAFGLLILYPKLTKAPSCTDGKMNGSETGVDCGGNCPRACIAEQDDISILWARSFRVVPGRYNAVAYVTNHNKGSAVRKINYRFRFGDENNVYIGKREGSTFIPPGGNFAVFEPAIDVGNSIPVYTTFEFTEAPAWLQVPEERREPLKLPVSDIELTGAGASPKLTAVIRNNSLFTVKDVGAVVVLYEESGNAVSASRTFVSELKPLEQKAISFTWPEPFGATVVETEIIPAFDVFSAKLE